MSHSTRIFDIGNTGLQASKSAIATTGHNIANVNSEGFSRQRVDQTAGPVIPAGRGTAGTGVRIEGITRTNDEYLQRRIEREAKNLGYAEEREIYLGQTEQIFNEANTDGLNRLVGQVFNEFRQLSTDPENQAMRASLRESTKRLAGDIKRMDHQMVEVQRNLDYRIEGYASEINALAEEITELNLLIDKSSLGGNAQAADLLDKRDAAIKRLGALGDISVAKDERNRVTITLGGRVAIVAGGSVTPLEVRRTEANEETGKAANRLSVYAMDAVPFDVTPFLKGGRMGALIEVRDQDIQSARRQLNDVALSIVRGVNEIHRQGVGLDGVGNRNFFKPIAAADEGRAAELMDLADPIKNSIEAIAAAKEKNAPGDNRIALAISKFGDVKTIPGYEGKTVTDIYNSMVGELATKAAAANRSATFQGDILSQLENFRESISGVNLDEETTNLIRFQHAYAANAKVLSVADEVLQTVINAFR